MFAKQLQRCLGSFHYGGNEWTGYFMQNCAGQGRGNCNSDLTTILPKVPPGTLFRYVCPALCDCSVCTVVEPIGINNLTAVGVYSTCHRKGNCVDPSDAYIRGTTNGMMDSWAAAFTQVEWRLHALQVSDLWAAWTNSSIGFWRGTTCAVAFDAVWMVLRSVNKLLATVGPDFTGKQLMQEIMTDRFDGISGPVHVDQNGDRIIN